jgi:hypothetical protein
MRNDYTHTHAAHCESGVVSSLLRHAGLSISEPMAFGLSRSLIFAHFPFIKIGGLPMTTYRMFPRSIIRGVCGSLGVHFAKKRFNDRQKGMDYLDQKLSEGKIVGVQTSVFWLPYFPENMRFHFNAHNLIVYGKEGGDYLIGDPVFETVTRCDYESLQKARFVKGALAPKGFIYYVDHIPQTINMAKAIKKSLHSTSRLMAKNPIPFAGVKGIYYLAKRIRSLEPKNGKYAKFFLGNIIRMQEEIGTGGAGFRFVYASFLEECGALLNESFLIDSSRQMTTIGDTWREFALMIAKLIKEKEISIDAVADKLESIADMEKSFFIEMGKFA